MTEIVIIGAGPAGLGAGWRLLEKGASNFIILEQNPYSGGLSASFKTPEGFIFDIGGHVCFSRDPYFRNIVLTLLKEHIHFHTRNASVYLEGNVYSYPFQDNIADLAPEIQLDIATDFLESLKHAGPGAVKSKPDFLNWIRKSFGETLGRLFMLPYNQKVWAYDLQKMGSYWIKDRVSTLTVEDILERIILGKKKKDWGPNAEFFFPEYGTGFLFEKMAQRLGKHIRYNCPVKAVDVQNRRLVLAKGEEIHYKCLISSMSIRDFVAQILPTGRIRYDRYKKAAAALRFNSGYIVGLGLDFKIETDKHWIYFPEKEFPWFRMTVISNYSPSMAPPGKSALMFDMSFNPYRGLKVKASDILPLLQKISFLPRIEEKDIVSVFEKKVRLFYPIPTIDRDKHLGLLNEFLEGNQIYPIGRFGRWLYEEGNMDHAFLHGKQAADHISDL